MNETSINHLAYPYRWVEKRALGKERPKCRRLVVVGVVSLLYNHRVTRCRKITTIIVIIIITVALLLFLKFVVTWWIAVDVPAAQTENPFRPKTAPPNRRCNINSITHRLNNDALYIIMAIARAPAGRSKRSCDVRILLRVIVSTSYTLIGAHVNGTTRKPSEFVYGMSRKSRTTHYTSGWQTDIFDSGFFKRLL